MGAYLFGGEAQLRKIIVSGFVFLVLSIVIKAPLYILMTICLMVLLFSAVDSRAKISFRPKTAESVIVGTKVFPLVLLAILIPSILSKIGFIVAAAGFISNWCTVVANNMKMPAKAWWAEADMPIGYTCIDSNTKLRWLGDCFPIFGALASVGDIFMVLGYYIAAFGLWLE